MRFELTDDQQAIQRTAKDFLADRYPAEAVRRLAIDDERGFTDEQWQAIAELGWPSPGLGEDDGGLGLGVVELAVLQEQLGYALAPTPLLSRVAAALVVSAARSPEPRAGGVAAAAPGGGAGARRGRPARDGRPAAGRARRRGRWRRRRRRDIERHARGAPRRGQRRPAPPRPP